MKTKLFALLMLAAATLFGCKEQAQEAEMAQEEAEAPDYAAFDKKVATIRAFFQAHCDENMDAMKEMVADTFRWSPPDYNGNKWLGKDDFVEAIKSYQDNFENMKYEEGIVMADSTVNGFWSGSVFPEENANSSSGIIRVYGTWSGTHSESGKEVGVKFFSLMSVTDDGKIAQASDYWDVNGLAVQIAAEE